MISYNDTIQYDIMIQYDDTIRYDILYSLSIFLSLSVSALYCLQTTIEDRGIEMRVFPSL